MNGNNEFMSQEEYEELLRLGGDNAALSADLQYQKDIADAMRTKNFGQGRQAGRVYVAPNPLEAVGGIAQNVVAAIANRRSREKQEQLTGNTNLQNQRVLGALLRGRQGAAPAGGGFTMPPVDNIGE